MEALARGSQILEGVCDVESLAGVKLRVFAGVAVVGAAHSFVLGTQKIVEDCGEVRRGLRLVGACRVWFAGPRRMHGLCVASRA